METKSPLVECRNGKILSLKDFIKKLEEARDTLKNGSGEKKGGKEGEEVVESPVKMMKDADLQVVTHTADTKTPEERIAYQKRLERLKAKIQKQEYAEMTKNVKSNIPHAGESTQICEVA